MKGFFKCKNPKKYKGNSKTIIYRSSYELKFFKYCDEHPEIVEWASEEFAVKYISPIDNKFHRYFPDVWVKRNDGKVFVIEIKPQYKLTPPVIAKGKKMKKSVINEVIDYGVNQAKWEAARHFCEEQGWEFQIMTETELGIKIR